MIHKPEVGQKFLSLVTYRMVSNLNERTRKVDNKLHLRISYYVTASTDESVLIIGGFTGGSPNIISTIAEYKDGSWKNIGILAQARYGHGAITSGSVTMIVGRYPYSESL